MDDPEGTCKQADMQHILSKDGTLTYDFMISLQNIVMAKIASNLWINRIIQGGVIRTGAHNLETWEKVENDVLTNVPHLSVQKNVSRKMKRIVKYFGWSIYHWIIYHDKYIISYEINPYSAGDLVSYITWTTRGKIDYLQTVKNILADEDGFLSDEDMYLLACTYCLEDKVALLEPKVDSCYLIMDLEIDIYPMVFFWTAHITGRSSILKKARYHNAINRRNRNVSNNEHIMELLINIERSKDVTFNDIPIRFMWNKLNEEEKTKNIKSLVTNVRNTDLILSLLSNLNYYQQEIVFKECTDALLFGIVKDWLYWRKYFLPTVLHIRDILNPVSYCRLLVQMLSLMYVNNTGKGKTNYNHYRSIFKELWKAIFIQLNDFIIPLKDKTELAQLVTWLSWTRDMDKIKLIMNRLDVKQKKRIAFGKYGIQCCTNFIKKGEWEFLELFLSYTLSSRRDVSKIKQILIQEKRFEIADHFFTEKEFHNVERFISWAFTDEDEIYFFRRRLQNWRVTRNCV